MPVRPADPASFLRPIGRRTLLGGAAGGAVLLTSACRPFTSTSSPRTVTVTSTGSGIADPLVTLIALTRLHLLRIQSWTPILSGDPTNQALLTAVGKDRQAHLTALIAEQQRTDPAAAAANEAPRTGQIPPPDDPQLIVPQVRSDAADAQQQFTDALALVARYRAALFASMAACLATHRVVLS